MRTPADGGNEGPGRLTRVTGPAARPSTLRRAVLASTAAAVALGVSACSFVNPIQTQEPMLASDGVPASIGDLEARSLLIIAEKQDAEGIVVGSLTNTGPEDLKVSVYLQDTTPGTAPVELGAFEQKQITGMTVPAVPAPPGAMTGLVIGTSAGQTTVQVPVLPPANEYATLTPSASPSGTASTSSPSGTATTGAAEGAGASPTTSTVAATP